MVAHGGTWLHMVAFGCTWLHLVGSAGRVVPSEDEGCGGLEVECFGGPLHEAGEAGRGVLLQDDEEAGEAALGGLGDTGTCHTS